jgi:hypothetical protein
MTEGLAKAGEIITGSIPINRFLNYNITSRCDKIGESVKTGILVYDTCVQFEVIFAAWFLKDKGDVTTYTDWK